MIFLKNYKRKDTAFSQSRKGFTEILLKSMDNGQWTMNNEIANINIPLTPFKEGQNS